MNQRSAATLRWPAPGEEPAGDPGHGPDDERAAVRVDRARTELRHGRPILVLDEPAESGGSRLVAAVETLSPARLAALAALGQPLRLVLTQQRLHALGITTASTARSLPLPAGISLDELQALAGLGSQAPAPPPQDGAEIADAALEAALAISKRARLSPALLVAAVDAPQRTRLQAEQWHTVLASDLGHVSPTRACALRRVSDARVPITATEDCTLVLFREIEGDAEHVAILLGQPDPAQPVPVRLHSSCLTGDLLGSLRCDCGDQLRDAVERLSASGGILLYLAQEGRGTGLASKLRAYRLQDRGLDTLEADRHLGFRDDERDFTIAAVMLQALGVERIRLLTNNPAKIAALRNAGIEVVDRVPLIAPANAHNARYLRTKRDRAGHLRPDDDQA